MKSDIRIVIAQRGWVMVGAFERQGHHIVLHRGATIRRWGTQGAGKGLAYLALRGPTDKTELEPFTLPFECLELTVVGLHACDPDVWEDVLEKMVMPA